MKFLNLSSFTMIMAASSLIVACSPSEQEVKLDPVKVTKAEAPSYDVLVGVLQCEGLNDWKAFARDYTLNLETDGYTYTRLADDGVTVREFLNAKIDDDTSVISLNGYYGPKSVPITFQGNVNGSAIRATGQRGERDCSFTGNLKATNG